MRAPVTLVSGGAGQVGRYVVEALLAAGHEVVVAGRTEPRVGSFSGPVGFRRLDLGDEALPDGLFAGVDNFVHAAFDHLPGRYRGGEGDDGQGFRRRNLDQTHALFSAAKAAGVGRAVFLSTRAVYGPRERGASLDETMPAEPDTLYGEVKLAAERALLAMSGDGFAGVALRITGVYGADGGDARGKWAGTIDDYLAGKPVEPRAGTEVHGEDVGAAVRLMLEAARDAIAGEVFNVSDILVDRRDVLAIVKRETGSPHPLPQVGDRQAVNAMETDKLRALGWAPGGRALFERTVAAMAGATRSENDSGR